MAAAFRCLEAKAAFLNMTYSCPRSKLSILVGRPFLLPPMTRRTKEKRNKQKKKAAYLLVPSKEKKGNYTPGGPGLPSSPASPAPASSCKLFSPSSGSFLLVLTHPTLVLRVVWCATILGGGGGVKPGSRRWKCGEQT